MQFIYNDDNMVETEGFFVKSVRKTAKEQKRNIKQNAGLHGLSCLMRTEKSTDIRIPNPQGRTGKYQSFVYWFGLPGIGAFIQETETTIL